MQLIVQLGARMGDDFNDFKNNDDRHIVGLFSEWMCFR
jgi:hypothetical protein